MLVAASPHAVETRIGNVVSGPGKDRRIANSMAVTYPGSEVLTR